MTTALIIVATCGWIWGVAEFIRANAEEDRADRAEAFAEDCLRDAIRLWER